MQNNITNKNILVTGGAGFIGSNLIEKFLSQSNKVICLDDFSTGKLENIASFFHNPNFTLIEGSIVNQNVCQNACKDIDIVFHEAALGSVLRSVKDPMRTHKVNVNGFLNMLVAACDNKVKRFIYASSSSVYGDANYSPKVEEKIGNPMSPYAITKYTNELYAQNFGKLYGIETIGLRYFNVFGPNQNPQGEYAAVFPKFIDLIINGIEPIIYGDGKQSRDFTYIENVVLANELAATTKNKEAINNIFNIGFGQTNELLFLTTEIIKIISQYLPERQGLKPTFAAERIGDIKNSCACIDKAKTMLNYDPKINVLDGLKKYIPIFLR